MSECGGQFPAGDGLRCGEVVDPFEMCIADGHDEKPAEVIDVYPGHILMPRAHVGGYAEFDGSGKFREGAALVGEYDAEPRDDPADCVGHGAGDGFFDLGDAVG